MRRYEVKIDEDLESIVWIDSDFSETYTKEMKGIWRYINHLPIDHKYNVVSLGEGNTPYVEIELYGKKIGVKLEHLAPTGSYKDRGASVLISKAKELGVRKVVQDSSGNAGCSVAAYAAAAGIACEILVPDSVSESKLAQMKWYGADVIKVKGSREATAQKAVEKAKTTYYASHVYNPFFLEGIKTFVYEVWEQHDNRLPDTFVLPCGNGTLILGCYIAFEELINAGLINSKPKLIAVQSENCCPVWEDIYNSTKQNRNDTIAKGIAIAEPRRLKQIVRAIANTNGEVVCVSDEEIMEALHICAKKGFYIEPTSAATIAGVIKRIKSGKNPDESIVTLFTGTGLKSTEKLLKLLTK